MIKPVLQDDAFLTDVENARADFESFHIWWLGQSGFLVQWQNQHLLLDPYLSDSLTKKYTETDKPHVRMTERVIAPERLDFINAVAATHGHTDHLDPDTLKPLLRTNPKMEVIIPEAIRELAIDRLGTMADLPVGLDAGKSVAVAGFKFTAIPAAHETVERDETGRCKFLGYVVEFGPWCLYHSGDTVLYDGMVDGLQPFQIDLALLPINGRAPERRVAGNLDGREAAALAKTIGARLVIPCHFEMFEFNTASPEVFVKTAGILGQAHRVLRSGERCSSEEITQASQSTIRPRQPI